MIKKADISNFITKCRNFKYSNVLLFAIFATTVHWQNCLFFTLLNPELLNLCGMENLDLCLKMLNLKEWLF